MAEIDPLERAAMDGAELPEGLSFSQQFYFLGLRNIYARFRAGKMDREQGSREKKRLQRSAEQLRSYEKQTLEIGELWIRTEGPAARFVKERTIEAAEKFYEAVYRMKIPERGSMDGKT